MAGGRGRHCALVGTGHIEQDEWELHRYEIDRSKCHDVAVENPDRSRR
jgi:arylsulfatase A-like enzyme